jgi:hypothetical protein
VVAASSKWYDVTVHEGSHKPDAEQYTELTLAGFYGPTTTDVLEYDVVFWNNTVTYPQYADVNACVERACSDPYCPCIKYEKRHEYIGANENKLFGFTRGIVPVMDKSCMFSWVQHLDAGMKITVFAYGWYNSTVRPWEHPIQNPKMADLDANVPYRMRLQKSETLCSYSIADEQGALVAEATTPQMEGGLADGVKFLLFFGGDAPATQDVTVSYRVPPSV